jgi:hypothetical protein
VKLTDAQKTEICERLADGQTTREIAAVEGMPGRTSIFKALLHDPDFANQYARSREIQLQRWEEDLVEIADAGSDGDSNRARLRVDTRKWLMSKRLPKKYGDKVALAGDSDNPIETKLQVTWGTIVPQLPAPDIIDESST